MTVQPPLAARREQAIDHEHAQDFSPVGALAVQWQTCTEKIIELQGAPRVIGQPARAPLAGAFEAQLVQPHLHRFRAALRRHAVGGKERELPGLALRFVKDRDGFLPRLTTGRPEKIA